ncbi:MAG: benzoate-CoA ligase family protein [Pyrinomonadaceae bacterium]|nr:benzoate-CoA ligase family protein [Pyrinomonadaceae bacterium]
MNLFQAIFTEQRSSSVAVVYENLPITYERLRDQTFGLAAVLNLLRLGSGERVALLLNDSPEFIASFISICSSGAIAVPINMGLRVEEQRAILNDCGARAAIVEADLCSSLLTDAQERLRELKDVLVVHRNQEKDSAQETQPAQRGRDEWHGDGPTIRELRGLDHFLRVALGPNQQTFPEPTEHEAAVILYTSGSTGEPKGAVHRQADIFYTNETYCREVLRLRAGDRIFSSSRLPFAYGLGNSLSFPLLNGVTSILCREKPTTEVISRVFSECQPTIFFGVPVIYKLLLEYHRRNGNLDCSSLRLCISAGEALPAQLGEDWKKTFGVEVLDGIGSTEMQHMFMSNHEGDVRYGSSGKLLNGYEARLLDQEGNLTPDGEVGNLWVKGESAAMGYWQKPEVTTRTFVDGWVRTGDLYVRDGDGFWTHMGRSDDCFKSSGQWVSPVEVEGALLRHAGVSQVAVVEDFDKDGLPCACAFVMCGEKPLDLDRTEDELRELLKSSLPRFKQPRRYFFVSELPYTATGKIQRFKLREQLRSSESKV